MKSQLIWFDRGGKQLKSVGEPGEYWHLELSPDERRVVVEKVDANNNDIWIIDLLHGIPMRFTFGPDPDIQPTWSPDGSHIVYTSYQGGGAQIYQRLSDGAGNPEVLIKEEATAIDWSRDGRFILYESKSGLSVLPLFGDHKPFPLLQTGESEGRFSPNGRWMAYCSAESGKQEVYIQSFPVSGAKWLISTNGGSNPRWRRDGKELFYLASDQKLMAVAVNGESAFQPGVPKALFQTRQVVCRYHYAVTADGQHFLVNTPLEEASTAPITVVLNWTGELKR
jgi:eukaryotic-like serine/threonine-protein kinase